MAAQHEGLFTQRDSARAAAALGSITRTTAKSTGFAILADRPSHIERDGINGFEQALATILILAMLVVTGATWALVPAVGATLAILGTYFVARRAAAFRNAPLRLSTFFSLLGERIPLWWTLSSIGLIAAAALHRSIVLAWIPSWVRDTSYNVASLAIVVNFALAIWLGIKAVSNHRSALAEQAATEAALAHMLGGTPRSLFEPSPQTGQRAAAWSYARGGHLIVQPQANIDLASAGDRLAQTALGQRFEVVEADWERILLAPISDETLERQRQRAASGGLIEGQHDLVRDDADPVEITPTFEVSDDDPWGNEPVAAPATETADPFAFGEEDWK